MVLNCMIVDDDIMARKSIERLCKKVDNLNITAICSSAEEALDKLGTIAVDLIFLDVEMPGLSGIDFLETAAVLPQIILTTSKTEYAYEAFEYQVTDYLKKPFTFPRFQKAVEKAVEQHEKNQEYKANANEVYVKEDGKFVRVSYDDILFFENVGDYVRIKTDLASHIVHSTLKNIDTKLNHERFLKVHRSFIVNLDKIIDIQENSLLIDKTVIPISRANKPLLMNRLNFL